MCCLFVLHLPSQNFIRLRWIPFLTSFIILFDIFCHDEKWSNIYQSRNWNWHIDGDSQSKWTNKKSSPNENEQTRKNSSLFLVHSLPSFYLLLMSSRRFGFMKELFHFNSRSLMFNLWSHTQEEIYCIIMKWSV
jgi:hypothetical protein